jgi:glycosyltransferase involved in cell wall biosynthesis
MISICTPTYNRAHTLPRLFESLTKQSSLKFEWIVVDDGSSDNTKELIEDYKNKADFSVKYIYQQNQGKHIALNAGQQLANYEIFLCLDSDDWLMDNAVLTIIDDYKKRIQGNENIAGMIYLNNLHKGGIIGTSMPHLKEINWLDLVYKNKMKGDKCYVFKTKVLKEYPFPSFENNKHMPPTYQFYLISQKFNMYSVNIPLKTVEYLDDGISRNIKQKYFTSADNYAYYRKTINKVIPSKIYQLKNIILYNVSYIFADNKKKVQLDRPIDKLISILLLPLSLIILIFYKINTRSVN